MQFGSTSGHLAGGNHFNYVDTTFCGMYLNIGFIFAVSFKTVKIIFSPLLCEMEGSILMHWFSFVLSCFSLKEDLDVFSYQKERIAQLPVNNWPIMKQCSRGGCDYLKNVCEAKYNFLLEVLHVASYIFLMFLAALLIV